MHLTVRRVARISVVVPLALGAAVVGLAPAQAVQVHRALNDTRPVSGAPVSVAFPVEYFGLVADLASRSAHLPDTGPAPFGEVRFRVHGGWTHWQALDQDGAQAAGHFTAALVDAGGADGYQVRGLPAGMHNVRAAAINTTNGPLVTVAHHPAGAANAAAACRSRADWGADESISGWAHGDTPTYYPDQVVTVHHTATSNDLNQDYSATVRAIYSYHVQTNGWSDIGYQYLVDGHGVVYEGRWSGHTSTSCLYAGGDGSDFAHQTSTDYIVTGAHVANYNSGNLGIALLGCYDNSSACSGDTTPPSAAVDSLEHLLASLSTRHSLDPQGSKTYVNPVTGVTKFVPTVSGHRDWEATACPGGNLYAQLPAIRSAAAALMSGTTPAPDFTVSLSPTSASVTAGKSAASTVSVADTGGTQTVNLRASGLPTGAGVAFSPASVTGTAGTTMTVTTASTTPAGTYPLTVTGSNGAGVTHSATYTLTVTAAKTGGKKH